MLHDSQYGHLMRWVNSKTRLSLSQHVVHLVIFLSKFTSKSGAIPTSRNLVAPRHLKRPAGLRAGGFFCC